mgnify:CR=1 FL=1
MKIRSWIWAIVALAFTLPALAKDNKIKYTRDKNGAEYYIFNPKKGARIAEGQVVTLHLKYSNSKDSVIFDSWSMGGPLQIQVAKPAFKGDLMSCLVMLTNGDSASFLISADSMFMQTFGIELPEFIEKGSKLTFFAKVQKVNSIEELKAEEKQKEIKKHMEETAAIDKYIADNNLKPQTTASGLKYVMYQEGTGAQATAGKTVRVHYTGKLLDGTKFDSSVDRNDPLEFPLGQGRVIKGWDEGIALLKVGGKALLIIPSDLGYGARGAGGVIPPFTPLTFEVELIEVK